MSTAPDDFNGPSRRCGGPYNLAITEGSHDDVGEINALYESLRWGASGGIRRRDKFLLAWHGDRLVGVLLYWSDDQPQLLPDDWRNTFGPVTRLRIKEILVPSDEQRRGVGSALIRAAADAAATADVLYLWLGLHHAEHRRNAKGGSSSSAVAASPNG